VAELLPRLSLQLRGLSREKPDLFRSGATDLPIVKRIKEIANRIILQKHSQSYAWRIEVALIFERYVQRIFEKAVKRIGEGGEGDGLQPQIRRTRSQLRLAVTLS